MSRLFLIAALLLGLQPDVARAQGSQYDDAFTDLASTALAEREAERIRLQAEVAFVSGLMVAGAGEPGMLLLDDGELRDALLERTEAGLADAELALVYLETHPLREGSQARIRAAQTAVDRGADTVLQSRLTWVEVLTSQRDAVLEALATRGLTIEPQALELALQQALAEAQLDRIQQEAAVAHYRDLVERGDTDNLLRLLPERSSFEARYLSRLARGSRSGRGNRGRGSSSDRTARSDPRAAQGLYGEALTDAVNLALATEEARVQMLRAVETALHEQLSRPGG
jgi:hypothetical protein